MTTNGEFLPRPRSAVTTGKRAALTPGTVDMRSEAGRRWFDLVARLTSEVGPDRLTEGGRLLIRRAASLAVQLEAIETELLAGRAVDSAVYSLTANSLDRHLRRLGVRAIRPADKEPTLKELLTGGPGPDFDDDIERLAGGFDEDDGAASAPAPRRRGNRRSIGGTE